jgi:uncharacterized membrane protein YphA (DoxX/SURF4 family)
MSQTLIDTRGRATTGKALNVVLWVLQIGVAAVFLMSGFAKLSGASPMVALFETIGVGQWFRFVTGGLEVLGALALLVPRFSGAGALLLALVMVGAIMTHLFIVGGSPLLPIVLLIVAALVAWYRRDRTARLLGR